MIYMAKIDCDSYEAKYLAFAYIIDMLATRIVEEELKLRKGHTMTTFEIRDILRKETELSKILKPFSDVQLNLWISELSWMGLIVRVSERDTNSEISLTKEGLVAYKSQPLHSIAASLIEARESRKLSNRAIWIAISSIIITAIFAILEFCCK